MAKINLTDRFISSDKRKPLKGRMDYPDAQVPGLALRVTSAGHRSFVLIARFPLHPKNPTRRALGEMGRSGWSRRAHKARDWLGLIGRGSILPSTKPASGPRRSGGRSTRSPQSRASSWIDMPPALPRLAKRSGSSMPNSSSDGPRARSLTFGRRNALPQSAPSSSAARPIRHTMRSAT